MPPLKEELLTLSAVEFGPTDLHLLIMKLKYEGLAVRMIYNSRAAEYPWFRSIGISLGDEEYLLLLPRHHDGVPVAAATLEPVATTKDAEALVLKIISTVIAAQTNV